MLFTQFIKTQSFKRMIMCRMSCLMYVVTSVGTGLQYPAPNIRFSTDIAEGGASLSGDPFPSHDPLPLRAKLEDKSLNVSTCSVINVCSCYPLSGKIIYTACLSENKAYT